MRTFMIALALVAVAAMVFAGASAANCGKCGKHGKGHSGCAVQSDCPGYDKATMTTFKAKVVAIENEKCEGCNMTHADLVVDMDGEKVSVRLGPSWYIDKQDELLEKGDVVEIFASKVKHGDDDVLVAGKITKGDDVLMLRDENGRPAWQGWRRGKA